MRRNSLTMNGSCVAENRNGASIKGTTPKCGRPRSSSDRSSRGRPRRRPFPRASVKRGSCRRPLLSLSAFRHINYVRPNIPHQTQTPAVSPRKTPPRRPRDSSSANCVSYFPPPLLKEKSFLSVSGRLSGVLSANRNS